MEGSRQEETETCLGLQITTIFFISIRPPQSVCSSNSFFVTVLDSESCRTRCSIFIHLDSTKGQRCEVMHNGKGRFFFFFPLGKTG